MDMHGYDYGMLGRDLRAVSEIDRFLVNSTLYII